MQPLNLLKKTKVLRANDFSRWGKRYVYIGSQTSLCVRNLTEYLHRKLPATHKVSAPEPSGTTQNPPETQQVSSPEPSGTSRGICTGTLWNLTRCLHRNLVRNLVLKLHRIAPELIWAKDPIAKFCCWGKILSC